MSFTFNNDKKPQPVSPKGEILFPLTQFMEVNRLGQVRYPAVKARGTLTLALNVSNNETVTIDTKVYTFVTTLTTVDGQVKIGATKEASIANLISAINLTGVPNSQYSTQTTLHPTVTAKIGTTTAKMVAIAKTGGVAGNSIATTETLVGAGNLWDGATLGTTVAGSDESDADSVLHPHYRGAVNSYVNQQHNTRENLYHGAGELDGSDDRFWSNKYITMNYPMGDYKLLAGATRKLFQPNHWDRNIRRYDTFMIKSFMQRPLWQSSIGAPFVQSGSNIPFQTVEMGDDRFALFYRQQAGTVGIYVIMGQMQNNGTVTWGTPVLITAKDQYDANFDAILVNTDKILCTYGTGASDFLQTSTLTIVGTAVTVNAPVQVVATAFGWKKIVKLNTDKALLAVYSGTTISLYVVTVTGTVPSYGAVVNQTTSTFPLLVANGTDKAQMIYVETATTRMRSSVITVVSTTPTIQASILIGYETTVPYRVNAFFQVATDKFVYYHPNGQLHPYKARNKSKFMFITVSGNTTSIGSTLEVQNTVYDANRKSVKPLGGNDYAMYDFVNKRVGKITVDTTLNTIKINDIPYRMNIWDDSTDQTVNSWKGSETDASAIMDVTDPAITTKGWAFCARDNNTGGDITIWTDKTFSFEAYVDDELVGTYTKSMPSVIEGVQVRIPLNRLEVPLKIKNTGTVDLFFIINQIIASID